MSGSDEDFTGKGISQQAYALARKILAVHRLAEADERVIEMHPEVSSGELASAPLEYSKHSAEGRARRRELLREAGIGLPARTPAYPSSTCSTRARAPGLAAAGGPPPARLGRGLGMSK